MELPRRSYSMNYSILQRKSTQFEVKKAGRIPLLVLSLKLNEGEFHLSQAAKDHLGSLKGECHVISVSGNPMVGKSSLLNLLLSFFNKENSQERISYQEMYPIGEEIESQTEGIDMYCLTKNGKNFIFLDIEGDNDPSRKETGVWIYTNLLQTAIGVSHIHLYNYRGLPQETLLSYFESITKVAKQNNIRPGFDTKFAFLRKDFSIESEILLAQKLELSTSYIDKRINRKDIDYSLHFLPTPPQHITGKRSAQSCIGSKGFLCKECQGHLFVSLLLDITKQINQNLSKMAPFQSGSHLCKALEQLVEINRRELPFTLNLGHISQIRLNTFRKEQNRIQAGLLEVEQYHAQNGLYKEVQKIMIDHPSLANEQLSENFNKTGMFLEIKIAQLAYMIPELSKFVDQYLLDERASILNADEKEALSEAYVAPFGKLLKEITSSLKKYGGMIDEICQNLLDIQTRTTTHLKEYLVAATETRNRTMTIGVELLSSGLLGFLGREAAGKAIAVIFVGGGVVTGVLTAVFFFQALGKLREAVKKNEEALNLKKIDGIKNVKDAEQEMKKMEEFVTQLVEELESSRETLKKICAEDERESLSLLGKIAEAMDGKIDGVKLSPEDRAELVKKREIAKNNLQRFKECL